MASAVVPAVLREPRAAWAEAPTSTRAAYAVGTVLMVVGMAHGAAWLLLGGAWEGPVSYRKPFSFGMSFGLTTITLAWLTQRLALPRRSAWVVVPVAAASVAEVAWVSLQRGRGVPSHFNVGTPLDQLLFSVVGGGAIAALVLAVAALTVAVVRDDGADRGLAVATRGGLAALWCAIAAGVVMIVLGNARAFSGQTTDLIRYGAAGSVKVTHALGMHGIQILPGFAFVLGLAGVRDERRTRAVAVAGVGYVALVLAATLQWLAGRPVSEPGLLDGAVAAAGGAALLAAVSIALRARRAPTAVGSPGPEAGGSQVTPAS